MKKNYKRNYQDQTQASNQPASVSLEVVAEATPVESVDELEAITEPQPEPPQPAVSHQTGFLQRVNQRIGKATICPDCGASGFTVNRTKPREDGQFRQRKCKQCGAFSNELQFPPIPLDIDGNPV